VNEQNHGLSIRFSKAAQRPRKTRERERERERESERERERENLMIWTGAAAVITEEATAARRRRRSRKAEDVWMDVGRKSERQREMVGQTTHRQPR
jgi:hypothetical protein